MLLHHCYDSKFLVGTRFKKRLVLFGEKVCKCDQVIARVIFRFQTWHCPVDWLSFNEALQLPYFRLEIFNVRLAVLRLTGRLNQPMLERQPGQQASRLLFSQVIWSGATWCSAATGVKAEV